MQKHNVDPPVIAVAIWKQGVAYIFLFPIFHANCVKAQEHLSSHQGDIMFHFNYIYRSHAGCVGVTANLHLLSQPDSGTLYQILVILFFFFFFLS